MIKRYKSDLNNDQQKQKRKNKRRKQEKNNIQAGRLLLIK